MMTSLTHLLRGVYGREACDQSACRRAADPPRIGEERTTDPQLGLRLRHHRQAGAWRAAPSRIEGSGELRSRTWCTEDLGTDREAVGARRCPTTRSEERRVGKACAALWGVQTSETTR